MKFRRTKPNPTRFDGRLSEIDEELRRLRQDMKNVSRGRPVALSPAPKPRARPAPAPGAGPAAAPASDLFSHAARTEAPNPRSPGADDIRAGVGMDKQKFGRYFSSGSFLAEQADPADRRVTKNRLILIVVVFLLIAFVIYSVFI
jgi:hypothetical protein